MEDELLVLDELLLEDPESEELFELDESDDPLELEEELDAESFLVEVLELEPLSLLSVSRVDPNDPAERLSVL